MIKPIHRISSFTTLLLALAVPATAVQIYYQPGFTSQIVRFDTATGTNTFIGLTGGPGDSFGMDFAGSTLYAHDRALRMLYTINTSTGAATTIGSSGIAAEDFTVNLAGTVGYATSGSSLYSINLSTGAATNLGSIGSAMDGLTVAPVAVTFGSTLYSAGSIFGVDSGSLYYIDVAGVSKTFLGSTSGANETLDFGLDGTLYGQNSGNMYRIDTVTFAATSLGATTSTFAFGMAVEGSAAVPDQGSLWFIAVPLAGLMFARSRRRR